MPKKAIEGNVIGFDFGLRRIGVAIGQTITQTASPETIVDSRDGKPDWDRITELFERWQPVAIVVGLPMRLDGSEQPLTQPARKFGQRLSGRYGKPVFFIEEQLSSIEAEQRHGAKKQRKSSHIDDHAAQIILENWLQQTVPSNS
ncbi:Holliday junction resolvase RuvX [Thiomicrorhabdus xiamenensis]|uniref:Putative pre-16S rRNA nuclease n=1 Tax=Thiomicrorhabdus xiamenensis TaxID=2739063 RepID=A0A7D4NQ87_9GAMM|nr:Holliday junction resolvase RuvX [Thiomicrorhabdus xiamenensis]QKI88510.1 Holliday junction resolvase RuvX [Thiomicrorhabdus xiamenensis]